MQLDPIIAISLGLLSLYLLVSKSNLTVLNLALMVGISLSNVALSDVLSLHELLREDVTRSVVAIVLLIGPLFAIGFSRYRHSKLRFAQRFMPAIVFPLLLLASLLEVIPEENFLQLQEGSTIITLSHHFYGWLIIITAVITVFELIEEKKIAQKRRKSSTKKKTKKRRSSSRTY